MKNLNRGVILSLLILLVIAAAVIVKSLVDNNYFVGSAVGQHYPYLQPFPSTSPQQQQQQQSQNTVPGFQRQQQ